MYAAEVSGSFSASLAMVATNFIRNAAFTGPGLRITTSMKSGGDVFSVTPSNKYDVDYLGQSTKGDLNVKFEHLEAFDALDFHNSPANAPYFFLYLVVSAWMGIDGHATLEGPIEEVARTEAKETDELLRDLGIPVQ